jgi:hypothetical protein
MNWKRYERKQLQLNVRYCPIVCPEELRKITKASVRIADLQARV